MKQHHFKKLRIDLYREVVNRNKKFEIRHEWYTTYNEGDLITLQQWHPNEGLTGKEITFRIGFVLRDFNGLEPNHCIFTLLETSDIVTIPRNI